MDMQNVIGTQQVFPRKPFSARGPAKGVPGDAFVGHAFSGFVESRTRRVARADHGISVQKRLSGSVYDFVGFDLARPSVHNGHATRTASRSATGHSGHEAPARQQDIRNRSSGMTSHPGLSEIISRVVRYATRFVSLVPVPVGMPAHAGTVPEHKRSFKAPSVTEAIRAIHAALLAVSGVTGMVSLFLFSMIVAAAVATTWLRVTPRPDLSSVTVPTDTDISMALIESLSAKEFTSYTASAEDGQETGGTITAFTPPRTVSFGTYTVVQADTLDAIARRFGVQLDTLISMNGITNVRRLAAGTTLKIPNMDGVVHVVSKGDSLSALASRYDTTIVHIIDANDLSSQTIRPGQTLFIPGARLSSYQLKKALGELVVWPLSGRISSPFGYRPNPFTGVRQFHSGLDIVAAIHTPIKASMAGRVAETGYSGLYGNFVILSHPEGYQTLYAHLDKILTRNGAYLDQGDTLGLLGNTGYSTGPHLHFGVYRNGKAIDPQKFLRG